MLCYVAAEPAISASILRRFPNQYMLVVYLGTSIFDHALHVTLGSVAR